MCISSECEYMAQATPIFCLGTEVPRHSSGCVGTNVVRGTYVAFRNAPAQVLHACSTPLTLCLRLSPNCDVRGRAHNAAVAYLRQDREAS